ncbi:MAG: hypothetical protein IVW52_15450 [Acidimicrobiales bacterium]|nr:hypothetical protein [Acidimicrobiales bacterium]
MPEEPTGEVDQPSRVARPSASPGSAGTSEGAQELRPVERTTPTELARERGAVLRVSEGSGLDADDIDIEMGEDDTMIISMGPQHPSTHGVLRMMLELSGETVLRMKPVIGYLHTGREKTAEELTYAQGATNVTCGCRERHPDPRPGLSLA